MSKLFWWWWFWEYAYLSANTFQIKKDKDTDYIIIWKLKGVYSTIPSSQHTAFLHGIKLSGYTIGIKFDKYPSAVEQNNNATKILIAYIVNDLDSRSNNLRNFTLNCLFGATSIVQNSDKENWVYVGYGIPFDRKGKWSFNNNYARNADNQ